MPGYESARFVECTPDDLREMLCTICSDVFRNPLVTACCGQTYCESCIKPWIESSQTCPSGCAKALKMDALATPPRVLVNLLNKFKLRCTFASRGCPEVCTVATIEGHEKNCIFDKELCKVCGFVVMAEHDCLRALLDYKKNIASITDVLRKELEDAQAQNRNLHAQNENFMRTIQDLTRERNNNAMQAANAKSNRVNTNKDLLVEARKLVNSPIVDGHKTRKDIVDKVVEVVKEAITFKGDKIYEVAKFVKEFMDSNFMGDWNCYLLHNNVGFVFHNIVADGFIEIKFGKVLVTVYKTFEAMAFSRLMSFIRAGAIKDFMVAKTGFDEMATKEIEKVVLTTLRAATDMNQFTDRVTHELMANYGGIWHCFIYKANFGFYCIRSEKGRFVLLASSEIKILIFQ